MTQSMQTAEGKRALQIQNHTSAGWENFDAISLVGLGGLRKFFTRKTLDIIRNNVGLQQQQHDREMLIFNPCRGSGTGNEILLMCTIVCIAVFQGPPWPPHRWFNTRETSVFV